MALLNNYLNAVRLYLPRNVDQQDLITELSEHLQIKLDEREAALGRALTLEGVVSTNRGRLTILNPAYTLHAA